MAIRTSILFIAVISAIVFGASCSRGADDPGRGVQKNRYFEPGIGITSPLIDCSPETGCKSFPDVYPGLYIQVVSARSFVVGLAADEIEASAAVSQIVLKSLGDLQPPMIESTGHSRVTVGFDESNNALNELRIHILLKEPMVRNQSYSVSVTALPPLNFTYQADFISPSIQVNQLGYLPNADKRAFAGNWLGTAGPMPVDHINFDVVRSANGQVVFQGLLETVASHDAWSGNTVYRADFSEVQDEGEYILHIPGLGKSQPFDISMNVFKPAFKKVFRLFYHSRNSIAIRAPWADPGYERPAGIAANLSALIHPAVVTSAFADNEEAESYKKVWRGWFDAGDYGQYVANVAPVWHAFGVGMDLLPAFFSSDDFNLPESNNGIPDIIDELEWGMDWLLSMQNQRNGGVYSRSVPVLWDEALPHAVKQPRYIFEITSHATATFAAMTALHSRLVSEWDPERAALVLAASKAAWAFLEKTEQWPAETALYKNPKNVHAGEYADNSATDNRLWAAAELYRATGELKYRTAFIEIFGDVKIDPTERVSFKHQSMAAFWSMYRAQQEHKQTTNVAAAKHDSRLQDELAKILINAADWYLRKADEHPFGAPVHQYMKYTGWGSFAHSTRATIPLLQAWSITGKQDYCRRSAAMTNPQLGANPQSVSYITGLGKRSPRYPLSLLSRVDAQVAPLNGIPVNGPHYHLPAIWPSTRVVNDSYIPANAAEDDIAGTYKSYPPLRRYVDSNLLPPMSEPTVAEYALTTVAFGLLSDGKLLCLASD
jgi:endoglucanase